MKRIKIIKYLGLGIGSILLVLLLLLFSSTLKVAKGISRVIDTPAHLVRLQVVNGSDVEELMQEVVESLENFVDSTLEIRVVDTINFDIKSLPLSFVVSREKDKTAAVLLAEKLGLDPSKVVYKPLEHNNRQVSATLVLGEDYKVVKLP